MSIVTEINTKEEETAIAYRQMFELWAWKDFQAYLDQFRKSVVNDFVAFNDSDAVEFKAGQYKGILSCLDQINRFLTDKVHS